MELEKLAGTYKITKNKVSVVFTTWEMQELTTRCLSKTLYYLSKEDKELVHIVVVDNSEITSSNYIIDLLKSSNIPYTFIKLDRNYKWSKAINIGIKAAPSDSEFIVLMNNDVEPKSFDFLNYFRKALQNNQTQHIAGIVDDGINIEKLKEHLRSEDLNDNPLYMDTYYSSEIQYIRAQHWCVCVSRRLYVDSGLYLEQGIFEHWWSDLEWCARVCYNGYTSSFINMTPDAHHWHQMSLLYNEQPHLYNKLIEDLKDPELERQYLAQGRPLWEI